MIVITTKNPEETASLGKKIASLLRAGDIVALTGELGSGKTTLIQGLAQGLGITGFVSSPSFVIINEYSGPVPLYHIDLYRLEDERDIEDLGIAECFSGAGIVAVEWAEKLGELLPGKYISITMEPLGENERKITIEERGIHRLEGNLREWGR